VVAFAIETEEKLSKELLLWLDRYEEEFTYNPFMVCYYRGNTTEMITAYLRLVILATGFQCAFKSGISRESGILKRSIDAARTVIQIMVDRLAPTGNLRYAMEANFLYVSFSAAYLLNLLRPKLLPLIDENTQKEIIVTVKRLIDVLGSKDVALDGRHTPALYSRFLINLLRKYNKRCKPGSGTVPDSVEFYPQYSGERQESPPGWPDIQQSRGSLPTIDIQAPAGYEPGIVYQEAGDADMDFSLGHFVRTVSEIPANSGSFDMNSWGEQWPGAATSDGWSSPQHIAHNWGWGLAVTPQIR